jgi:hypothetical protein
MEMTDSQLIQSVIKMQEELALALTEVSRLTSDMALAKVNQETHMLKPSFSTTEEERDQVMRFLFNLQKSGITNMMSADDFIQKRFGFVKAKCEEYLFNFIDNYTEFEAMYSKPKEVPVSIAKKRKGPKPYSEMTAEELADAKARKANRDPKVELVPVDVPVSKKTVIKLKKKAEEPKPKGVLIWNAFMNTVKAEMMQTDTTIEPSYNDIIKKAQELKESDPDSYKLFSDNWAP